MISPNGRAAVSSRRASRAGRLIRFAIVGASGLVVNQAALWLFTGRFHVYYLLSALLATQCSTLWNFAFTESWVFHATPEGRLRRFFLFFLLNNAWLAIRAPLMFGLTDGLGVNYLVSNFVALGLATIVRFAIADTKIWRPTVAAIATDPAIEREAIEEDAGGSFLFPLNVRYYDVHGIVGIRSEARLPELESFLVPSLPGGPDISIEVGKGGFGGPRLRAGVSKDGEAISYVEHLGGAGFAMRIEPDGEVTRVRVSRLLQASPHVLYTNVIEPVLRWEMVKKGSILAHAACLEIDGTGVLISAQTDTGKTTTCLRSIRNDGAGFVSDDMVIISPDGIARNFPKPLTISAHTLKAARSNHLPLRSRLRLQVQGRLHSKSGRRVGLALASRNLPVCTLNALIQLVVPPPKFHVQQIIPDAEIVDEVALTHMIVIERGDPLTEVLNQGAATQLLTDNTEDAYGFPPYPLIADMMANGASREEAAMRRQIVARLSAVRLRTPDRSWSNELSRLVAEPRMAESPSLDDVVVVPDLVEELSQRGIRRPLARGRMALEAIEERRRQRTGPDGMQPQGAPGGGGPAGRETAKRPFPWHAVIFFAIIAVAAGVRLWQINRIGLSGDEAVYSGQAAVLAGKEWASRYFILVSRGNSNFLLYQSFVAIFYWISGVSDLTAKLVSVGFSVGTVFLVYRIGTAAYDRTTGLIGSALLAVSGYSVLLGRLALLDATMAFLFTLAVLFAVRWIKTERPLWFYCFAAAAALAIQAKVTAGLVVLAVMLYLVVSKRLHGLNVRTLATGVGVFLVFLLPALLQVITHRVEFFQLLSESSGRSSLVPWYYYISTITRYEGNILPVIWLAGFALALRRRTRFDILLLLAAGLVIIFFQYYPLKAFNYMLPAIPVLAVLGGRALTAGARALKTGSGEEAWLRGLRAQPVSAIAFTLILPLLVASSALPMDHVIDSNQNAGLREAALWLRAHTPPDASVMTLSNGSGQYIFSFYAQRDAYPFGRFRLATVLPGGRVTHPTPTPSGDPPLDWISKYPPQLLADGSIQYLAYYTQAGDDPPETPIVQSQNQRDFRRVVENYGGELVYTAYYNHEGRVWIYRVHRFLADPVLNAQEVSGASENAADGETIRLEGQGFQVGSPVKIYVHQSKRQDVVTAGADGTFSTTVTVDGPLNKTYWIVAVDDTGNYASVEGREIQHA